MEKVLHFSATPEKGKVSALLSRPPSATHMIVLGHGASTNMRHSTMQSIADALARQNIASLRYNFPYSERGGGGRDSQAVCVETVRSAVRAAQHAAPDLTLLAGGHSFGGRMTTTAESIQPIEDLAGLVLFSFPLHLAGRPDTKRAEHLSAIKLPMLFLSGSRDQLAARGLFEPIVRSLGKRADLHIIETADHGYKILKRTRTSAEDIFDEMARILREWIDRKGL